MINIAIFASGSGTNAQRIAEYFKDRDDVNISLILSNKKDAYVLERAAKLGIPSVTFTKDEFYNSTVLLDALKSHSVDYIILAGFLLLMPTYLLDAFPERVLNIHPALLPKYGGKGMYGMKVHEAVVNAGERLTGITIHIVNSKYDEGDIVFQAECDVEPNDTAEDVANRIHQLEYKFFPVVIERFIFDGNK